MQVGYDIEGQPFENEIKNWLWVVNQPLWSSFCYDLDPEVRPEREGSDRKRLLENDWGCKKIAVF